MPRHFSRHEQFLRIFALLDILANAHQPIDDQSLIAEIKERLGLSRLSARTLHRDCDFLLTCGYPIDRSPAAGDRRSGWQFTKRADNGKRIPQEPITLLELVAFNIGRDLLRPFEGTVLWTGIEALRHKLERLIPEQMLTRLDETRQVFEVEGFDASPYANRPRLISTLSGAISDCREINLVEQDGDGVILRHRLQPHRLVIRPPNVELIASPVTDSSDGKVLRLDLNRIQQVEALDVRFSPQRDGPA